METRASKRKLEAALLGEDDAANANHPAEDSYAVHLDVDAYLANFVAAPEGTSTISAWEYHAAAKQNLMNSLIALQYDNTSSLQDKSATAQELLRSFRLALRTLDMVTNWSEVDALLEQPTIIYHTFLWLYMLCYIRWITFCKSFERQKTR
jgi:hypothetical protein